MRIVWTVVLFVLLVKLVYAQDPPLHSNFDTPFDLIDGMDFIDSSKFSALQYFPQRVRNSYGNWYEVKSDVNTWCHIVTELYSSGAFKSGRFTKKNDVLTLLEGFPGKYTFYLTDSITYLFYLGHPNGYEYRKFRIKREDFIPTNPFDDLTLPGSYEINNCLEISVLHATPSSEFYNNPNRLSREVDIFYEFIGSGDAIFETIPSSFPTWYEIYLDHKNGTYSKIPYDWNVFGIKYNTIKDSTYLIRVIGLDPTANEKTVLCLESYNPDIHKEEDNFQCFNSRTIEKGTSAFIDTFSTHADLWRNCQINDDNPTQWFNFQNGDSALNWTMFVDTNLTKYNFYTGDCNSLKCLSDVSYTSKYGGHEISFTLESNKKLFINVMNIDPTYSFPAFYPSYQVDPNSMICLTDIPPALGTISGTQEVCVGDDEPEIVFNGVQGSAPYTFTYSLNKYPLIDEEGVGLIFSDEYTDVQSSICMPVTSKNFDKITSLQGGLSFDSDVLSYTESRSGAIELLIDSKKADEGLLRVLWTSDLGADPLTVPDGEVLFEFCFDLVGNNGESSNLKFIDIPFLPIEVVDDEFKEAEYFLRNGSVTIGEKPNISLTSNSNGEVRILQDTDSAGIYTYSLISVSDSNGCEQEQTGTVEITVHPLPIGTIRSAKEVCITDKEPQITFTGHRGCAPYTFKYSSKKYPLLPEQGVGILFSDTYTNGQSTICVPVTSKNFTKIAAFQTGLNYDPLILRFVEAKPHVIDPIIRHFSNDVSLIPDILWYIELGDDAITVDDGTVLFELCFNIIGSNGQVSNIEFIDVPFLPVEVVDEDANAVEHILRTGSVTIGDDPNVKTIFSASDGEVSITQPTDSAGIYTYSLISVSDSNGCSLTQNGTAELVVRPLPTASIGGTKEVCEGEIEPEITFIGDHGTAPYIFTYGINKYPSHQEEGVGLLISDTYTNAQNSICIPITVRSFINIAAFQGGVSFDNEVLTYAEAKAGIIQVQIGAVSAADGELRLLWNIDVGSDALTLPDGEVLFELCFDVVGKEGDVSDLNFVELPFLPIEVVNIEGVEVERYVRNGSVTIGTRTNLRTVTTTTGSEIGIAQPTDSAGIYVYTLLRVSDSNGCSQAQTGTVEIAVRTLPIGTISGTKEVCVGDIEPDIIFTGDQGMAPYTFTFSVNGAPDTMAITLSGNSISIPQSTTKEGIYTYNLKSITDANGCHQILSEIAIISVGSSIEDLSILGPDRVCQDISSINYEIKSRQEYVLYNWNLISGEDVRIKITGNQASLDFGKVATEVILEVTAEGFCGTVSSLLNIEIGSPAFCALASCLRQNIYVDNELLALSEANSIYKAELIVSSSAKIEYPILFRAGQSIDMFPQFEVIKGALFIAEIESCNTD